MISDPSILNPADDSSSGQTISVTRSEPAETLSVSTNEGGQLSPPDSVLVTVAPPVPCGTLVPSVKLYLERRTTAVARYEEEKHLFRRLPVDERATVRRLQAAVFYVRDLSTGTNKISVQAACARALVIYSEFAPLKTFRGKYDAWLKSQDWLCLVNRSKAGPDWQQGERGLCGEFLDYVAARIGDFKRDDGGTQAIKSIHRQWLTGRTHRGIMEAIPGYTNDWDQRAVNLLPPGWDVGNIQRQLKRRAKLTRAVKKLRHEGIASARSYLPQVHGTRVDLRFMELIQFDDVRCDFRVIDTERGQICDLWLLIARDVATTMLLGFGMRPALARDDGSQEHLKLRDMKQLAGWMLETYGLPPWVMQWVLENGTATLDAAIRAALAEMLGDRIDFRMASMIGGKSSAEYWEKAVGNSKAKAMLESLNRLIHTMTSYFPGQIGATYGVRPAELIDREREALAICQSHRPEDRAQLSFPVLTVPQAREKLLEIFRLQNSRRGSDCEGFDKVVEAYVNGQWVTATTAHAGCPVRSQTESPVERGARLVAQHPGAWSRVAPEILTSFYEHTQRQRPVEASGEISLTHEGKLLRFAPPSDEFALAPGTKVLCYFNPDDPRFLTITDGRGGILGTWLRRGLVAHNDRDALAAAIRHSAHALKSAKARATELASDERAQLQAMRDHNNGFVTVTTPLNGGRETVTSPVAAHIRAVAGEKAATHKQQQRRNDDAAIAREALRNLAT